MPLLRFEDPISSTSRTPTEEDWAAQRPAITSLYINNDLTLVHVKRIMQLRHGFKATEKMYKTRFKRWKLKKYVSACDKEAVAHLLDVYRRKGFDTPDISLNGRRVPLHVVRRHCRRNQIFRETCDNLPYAPDLTALEDTNVAQHANLEIPHSDEYHEIPVQAFRQNSLSRPLSLTSEFDQTQYVLTLTGQYFQWHFKDHSKFTSPTDSRPEIECSGPAHLNDTATYHREIHRGAMSAQTKTFFDRISEGLNLLVAGQSQAAWKMIHEGCDMVRTVFRNQHRSLLKVFYRAFSDARWKKYNFEDLLFSLFRYFRRMSEEILGPQHPLSMIMRLCQSPGVFRESSRRVFDVILDISVSYVGAFGPEIPGLKRAQCETAMMNGEYDTAEKNIKILLLDLGSRIGENHYDTRRTLRRVAQIYVQQHLYKQTISVYLDEIKRARLDLEDAFANQSCRVSYHKIAYAFNNSGDIDNAERYWRLAHDGPVVSWHCPSSSLPFIGHHLNDRLHLQAKLQSRGLTLNCMEFIPDIGWPRPIPERSYYPTNHRWTACNSCG